ncbi:MAG TPA: hypothetical protein VGJ02_02375 [Pyrinomonadaceae bacterium]|jgi:hypothetical protein
MTSVENGVDFDLYAADYPLHLSWTSAGSTNAFLVLDRNGNGVIDNGQELFGDITPQPLILHKNGFNALAVYDEPDNGGNGDGAITASDAVFTQLRLWQDTNHNGISESGELHTLSDLGLASIDLHYKASQRTDQFGNKFYFRAKVTDAQGRQLGRWAWDVFLIVQP